MDPENKNKSQSSEGTQPIPSEGQQSPLQILGSGKEKMGQSTEGTQPIQKEGEPMSSQVKMGQSTEGTQPVQKEEEPKNSQGKEKMDQSSEGTQSIQKKEEPKSTQGEEKMSQSTEGTQPIQKEEEPKGNQGKEKIGQSSEGTQPVQKKEKSKSSQGKKKIGQSSGGTQPAQRQEESKSSQGKEKIDQSSEAKESVQEKKEPKIEILELLGNCKEEAVVLTGTAGVGKTWLATEVAKSAVTSEGSFYMSLWISLKYEMNGDYRSLIQSVALQLSIPTSAGVWEDVDDIDDYFVKKDFEDWKKEEKDEIDQLPQKVRGKLEEKLNEMQNHKNEKKYTFLLLVLDSEGVVNPHDYNYIMKNLFQLENLKNKPGGSFKVLITTREIVEDFRSVPIKEFKIPPLLGNEAASFLQKERVGDEVIRHPKFETFRNEIGKRNEVLPAQMIMLAETLYQIAKDGSEALERAFDAAHNILEHAESEDLMPLLHFAYDKLPDDCIIDCFWHSWNFLKKHGGVQYNELIAHWILEGHLDLAAGVKAAYEKGYQVMTELVDRGMLKMQEDNLIVLEGATGNLYDRSCRELYEKSELGLASTLDGDNRRVFERIVPADGMMKTASVDKKEKSVSSLLLDGRHLCREVPNAFFEAKQELKVLALFYPRLTSLPESIPTMGKLVMFVLRGCYLLNDINCIKDLKALEVLEVSGSPLLKKMSDDFFQNMSQLRSLNLSALGIKSLPPSFSQLTALRRLILRKCSFLEALPKLAKLKELEVIDLSGSSSLKKIQEKSFKSLEKLRFIDFSETKIEKLPIVQTLKHLKILLVRGCDQLYGLRSMKSLPELKVLDVSGATRIKEIYYDCFKGTENLKILDLSKTEIGFLPDSLGKHLRDLKLKSCPKLVKLLNTVDLTDLESLDLSESSGLKNFPDRFFEYLTSLRSLNLSNTKVASLPSPSNLQNLRRLLLRGCSFESLPEFNVFTHLEELDLSNFSTSPAEQSPSVPDQLPSLAGLKYLEIINLSGYEGPLGIIGASFEHMSRLQVLNLSETQISSLPSLCSPSKLRSLILRNCTKLQSPPKFEILTQLEELDLRGTSVLKDVAADSLKPSAKLQTLRLSKTADAGIESLSLTDLKKLEVLDISGEAVESLPSLDGLSNLRELLLRGCSSLKGLPSLESLSHLEVLDLSGTRVKELGEKISKLTHLKRLHLPEEVIEEFKKGEYVKFLPLELKLDRCCISKPSDIPKGNEKYKIIVHGTEFFTSLKEITEENSALRERIKLSISSIHSESKDEDNYGNSRKHIFSDIYSKVRKLPDGAEDGQSLEIRGFDDFPVDIDVVLVRAKYVFLVENNFLKNLSDIKPTLTNIRGLWLERCTRVESIFTEADLGKWENLEILWISNLPNLKSLYDEKVQSSSLKNLKQLYIDCCPMLETVFSSGQIPENLETLQITFCDKLKTLVGDKDNREAQTKSSTSEKVQNTSSVDKGGQTKEGQDKKAQAPKTSSADKKVQVPKTSSADNKGQAQTPTSAKPEVQTTSSINLKYLHISYCPMLETVFSSEQLLLTNLEILQIKFCDRLKSLSPQELRNPEVPQSQTSHPSELPNQTSSSTGLKSDELIQKDDEVPDTHQASPESENAPKIFNDADEN